MSKQRAEISSCFAHEYVHEILQWWVYLDPFFLLLKNNYVKGFSVPFLSLKLIFQLKLQGLKRVQEDIDLHFYSTIQPKISKHYRLKELRSHCECTYICHIYIYTVYVCWLYIAHKREKIWSITKLYELLKISVFRRGKKKNKTSVCWLNIHCMSDEGERHDYLDS